MREQRASIADTAVRRRKWARAVSAPEGRRCGAPSQSWDSKTPLDGALFELASNFLMQAGLKGYAESSGSLSLSSFLRAFFSISRIFSRVISNCFLTSDKSISSEYSIPNRSFNFCFSCSDSVHFGFLLLPFLSSLSDIARYLTTSSKPAVSRSKFGWNLKLCRFRSASSFEFRRVAFQAYRYRLEACHHFTSPSP